MSQRHGRFWSIAAYLDSINYWYRRIYDTKQDERSYITYCITRGGYSDDPSDSGGKTNHGITEKVARQSGYTGDMRDLSLQQAQDIYVNQYIVGPKLDKVYDID